VLAAGTVSLVLNQLDRSSLPFRRLLRGVARAGAVLLLLVLVKAARYAQGPWNSDGFAPIPRVPLVVVTTESGLPLYIPQEGDQVWDAPLPSSTGRQPGLRLRDPTTLAAGFEVRHEGHASTAGTDRPQSGKRRL
jgi:hypothetical protein